MGSTRETFLRDARADSAVAPLTYRSFGGHLRSLGIEREELYGARILVLGPGSDFAFERGALDVGAESVTALGYFDRVEGRSGDGEWVGVHEIKALQETHPQITLVNALFEDIPEDRLPPSSFNRIVSVWGFPMYSNQRHPSPRNTSEYVGMQSTMSILTRALEPEGYMKFSHTGDAVGRYIRTVVKDTFGKSVSVQRRRNHRADSGAVLTIVRKY